MHKEPDNGKRDAALARIRADLQSGAIDRLTFRSARNAYNVTSQDDIRWLQHQLRKENLLVRRGSRFVAAA